MGLRLGAVLGLLREAKLAAEDVRPLLVTGALAEQLAQELARDAQPDAVRTAGRVEDAAALVRVLAGEPTEEDEEALRAANRAGVPLVAVQTSGAEHTDVPYVLATDVVPCPPGAGFPVEEIMRALATRLGEAGTALAARLPALREPLCEELVESFSRKNGVLGVAVFVPGADFPVLTLNQLRLVLRIGAAHGVEVDQSRLPEIAGTVAAGYGFRLLSRRLLGRLPVAGWMVKGAVAYGGTRAVGEAAQLYFATLASDDAAR